MNRNYITELCKNFVIENYTINHDGSIDVNGCVDIKSQNLNEIPLQFNHVNGNFNCSRNLLTSLLGSPKKITGDFYCFENNLEDLVGAPENIYGEFYAYFNPIKTLEGAPKSVQGNFYISGTKLTNLVGCPE